MPLPASNVLLESWNETCRYLTTYWERCVDSIRPKVPGCAVRRSRMDLDFQRVRLAGATRADPANGVPGCLAASQRQQHLSADAARHTAIDRQHVWFALTQRPSAATPPRGLPT